MHPSEAVARFSERSSEAGVRALVFAPSPLLTVTVEARGEGDAEVHLHAGGQGFWIARMMGALGMAVRLCGSFGGESGRVVAGLIEREGIDVCDVAAVGANGAYVHDRRSGERITIAEMSPAPLSRHEVDELYGAALTEGLESDVCVLGGPVTPEVLPADIYRRLAADLGAGGTTVVADLAGPPLAAVLAGGVAVLKVSHEELLAEGRVANDTTDALVAAVEDLVAAGAANVVVSRAEGPAVALVDGRLLEAVPPSLQPVEPHGAGDSMTAGLVAGLARGGLDDALRLGVAAGALNVTRRGLATGRKEEIERLARHVQVRPLTSG